MKEHGLHRALTEISSDGFQQRLRHQRSAAEAERIWRARLGEPLHDEMAALAARLRDHPRRGDIVSYLLAHG